MIATSNFNNSISFLDRLNSNSNFKLGVKIISLTAATSAFFTIQMGRNPTVGCGIALTVSALTLFSEKVIRPLKPDFASSNWINTNINKAQLKEEVHTRLIYGTAFATLVFGCIFSPAQTIATAIQALHLKTIALVIVIAPLAEEILFRGFLQERIEDILIVINYFVIEIKSEKIEKIASYASSVIFGAIHIIGNQTSSVGGTIIILTMTTLLGRHFSTMKNENGGSLLPSIAVHMAHNTAFSAGLILAKVLFRR